jgi:hypothetical protein
LNTAKQCEADSQPLEYPPAANTEQRTKSRVFLQAAEAGSQDYPN